MKHLIGSAANSLPNMSSKKFVFICGDDEYLVTRAGQNVFESMTAPLTHSLSQEVIQATASRTEEGIKAIHQFQQAIQIPSLFGEKKVVWLKSLNFLADSVIGRTTVLKEQLERLQKALEKMNPQVAKVLITASPIDRRRKEYKWLYQNAIDTIYIGTGREKTEALAQLVELETKRRKVHLSRGAMETLEKKVSGNAQVLINEIAKLATYLAPNGGEITEKMIGDMVPHFGEGDFFEFTEAFYHLDLKWALEALRRHFFIHEESRSLIATLQGRNRLLIQLRSLFESGVIPLRVGGKFSKAELEAAAASYGHYFEEQKKSLFSQNHWYLSCVLAPAASQLSLAQLMDFQMKFLEAFEEILQHPTEQESILGNMTIRCLSHIDK